MDDQGDEGEPVENIPEILATVISCNFFKDVGEKNAEEAAEANKKLSVAAESSADLARRYLIDI